MGKIIQMPRQDDYDWVYVCPECNSLYFSLIVSGPGPEAEFIGFACEDCEHRVVFEEEEIIVNGEG